MKMNDAFPSKWLKPNDFAEDEDKVLTITESTMEEIGQQGNKEWKVLLKFKEIDKVWTVNQINWKSIEKATKTEDSDEWVGKRITLYATDVQFGKEMVPGIRVRTKAPASEAPGQRRAAPVSAKPAGFGQGLAGPPGTIPGDEDEDLPF